MIKGLVAPSLDQGSGTFSRRKQANFSRKKKDKGGGKHDCNQKSTKKYLCECGVASHKRLLYISRIITTPKEVKGMNQS
jgi:hypothetical protein